MNQTPLPFWFRASLFAFAVAVCCFSGSFCQARELKVSRQGNGDYTAIQAAINAAQPGDVILLSPQDSPYYESAVFRSKSGTAEKPIILNGQGATLNGSAPLRAEEWQETETGLYRSTAFGERMQMRNAILSRFYFIMNGVANRMGRNSKGKSAPHKPMAELQPGEWTYVAAEKAFYIRLAPGQSLDTVRAPERGSGVVLNGNCEHLRIRNLTVTHVWNDGFNIHQRSRDIRFENIRAVECGDDGISAHEDCHITVDGFVSLRNSTGLCHVGQSRSETRNFVLEDNLSYGIYLLDDSQHTLGNGIVRSQQGHALRLTNKTTVEADNILLIGEANEQAGLVVEKGAVFKADHFSVWNLPVTILDTTVQLINSVIATNGKPVEIATNATWEANNNLWDVPTIRRHGTTYQRENFAAYQQASRQDANSRWESVAREKLVQGELTPHGIKRDQLPQHTATK